MTLATTAPSRKPIVNAMIISKKGSILVTSLVVFPVPSEEHGFLTRITSIMGDVFLELGALDVPVTAPESDTA